ncbi:MAG TPA: glycosyltransferase family 87 protein [Candidatus Nanopelagicales bacterium]|nr:glycosyltransferase family 87 protein [Candidatus Nanopelagicales bacterium]
MPIAARIDALLDRERVRNYSIAFLVLGVIASIANVALGHGLRVLTGNALFPDFLAHWTGGRLLLDGQLEHLYDADFQAHLQWAIIGKGDDVSWFVGPPFTAVLYVPFAALPFAVAGVLWTLVSIGCIAASLVLLKPLLPRLAHDWTVVVLAVLASQPVLEVIGSGQDSAVSMLVWAAGLRLLVAGRDAGAGLVFGAGLIKPQLVALAPPIFLIQRRWSALATWLAMAALAVVVSVAVVGVDGIHTWITTLTSQRYDEQINVGQAWKQLSASALLVSLAPPAWAHAMQMVGLAVCAALVVAFLVAAWRAPRAAWLDVWTLAALTTVVASPHLLVYDLLIAVPAALVLLDRHPSRRVRIALLAAFVLTYLNPVLHLVALKVSWPLTLAGAPWAVVPLLVLWYDALRACRAPVDEPAAVLAP